MLLLKLVLALKISPLSTTYHTKKDDIEARNAPTNYEAC